MKLTKRINTSTSVEVVGDTVKDVFYGLADMTEAFGENQCGNCNSDDIKFIVRKVESEGEKYEYPEMACQNCFAKLSFGTSKEGGLLYPKRMETTSKGKSKGTPLPNRGWVKYQKE